MSDVPPAPPLHARSFEELAKQDLVPFFLGVVYVYAGVQEDLTSKFMEEYEGKLLSHLEVKEKRLTEPEYILRVRRYIIQFNRLIAASCNEWGVMLNVMDRVSYLHFKSWLLSQQFVSREDRKFSLPRLFESPILDPLIMDTKGLAVPAALDVFGLSGLRGVIRPVLHMAAKTDAKTHVEFRVTPPEEDTIILGRAALQTLREL